MMKGSLLAWKGAQDAAKRDIKRREIEARERTAMSEIEATKPDRTPVSAGIAEYVDPTAKFAEGENPYQGIKNRYWIRYNVRNPQAEQEKMMTSTAEGKPYAVPKTRGSLLENIRQTEASAGHNMRQFLMSQLNEYYKARAKAAGGRGDTIEEMISTAKGNPDDIFQLAYADADALSKNLTGKSLKEFYGGTQERGLLTGGISAEGPKPPELPLLPIGKTDEMGKQPKATKLKTTGMFTAPIQKPIALPPSQQPTISPTLFHQGSSMATFPAKFGSALEQTDTALRKFFKQRGRKIGGEMTETGQAINQRLQSLIPNIKGPEYDPLRGTAVESLLKKTGWKKSKSLLDRLFKNYNETLLGGSEW